MTKFADDKMTGSEDGKLKNALDMPQWELKTGGKRKGKFVMQTGWYKTGGVDSQNVMQFKWQLEPSSDYNDEASIISFAFAKDQHTPLVDIASFSRVKRRSADGKDLTVHSYEQLQMTRTLWDLEQEDYLLSTAEQLQLAQSRYPFYFNEDGVF